MNNNPVECYSYAVNTCILVHKNVHKRMYLLLMSSGMFVWICEHMPIPASNEFLWDGEL